MSRLLQTLPPLSPDYSGVASALHDLGALTVIHDASGCTGTYAGYDEPRWFGSRSPVFCSGLRDLDAVMGDDDKLLSKLRRAAAEARPPLAAVVGSPVPMVVGFDFQGFAALAERETGVPTLGFPANGLGLYDDGQRAAYAALFERFLPDGIPREPRTVNLLGASALDGFDDEALDLLEALASEAGLRRLAVWGARSPLSELERSGAAAVNWVVTAAALPLARRLRERYGTPFVVGLPIGSRERRRLLAELAAIGGSVGAPLMAREREGDILADARDGEAARSACRRVLVVGERLLCESLRAWLEGELGLGPVAVAGFFSDDPCYARRGYKKYITEAEASNALREPGLELVIGDPLLSGLLSSARLVPLPHAALSGRLYRESRSRLFEARGLASLTSLLGGSHDYA